MTELEEELERLDVELDRVMWLARSGRVDYDDALAVLEDHYERAVERQRERAASSDRPPTTADSHHDTTHPRARSDDAPNDAAN